MTIKHYPWLENTLKKYEQRNFASSIIIEGESGLAKSELASHFAKRLLCSQIDAPCNNCNSCNYYEASSHPDFCFLSSDSCSSSLYSISKAKKDSIVSNSFLDRSYFDCTSSIYVYLLIESPKTTKN